MPRHETYRRNPDGTTTLVSVEDARSIEDARGERRSLILAVAHERIHQRLIARGYPSDVAGVMAGILLLQELPQQEQSALASIASTIMTRARTRLKAIDDATSVGDVDGVNPDTE